MEALINAGADVNAYVEHFTSALNFEANKPYKNENEIIVDLLFEAGAGVNVASIGSDTAQMRPAWRDVSPTVITGLINAAADVNLGNVYCKSAISCTAERNFVEGLDLLIDAGANVNMTSSNGSTALMTAAIHAASLNVVTALINAGADVNKRNSKGKCAITFAAERNFVEGLELLTEAADKMDPTRSYLPPLSDFEFDLRSLTTSTLKLLLRIGSKINVPSPRYNNTLTYYIVQCKIKHDRVSKYICMFLFAAGERDRALGS